jgi:nicotinate-nucleotide adenylyltransferase
MKMIALLGGSFNPPHIAHQMACLVALEVAGADEAWMVPTYRHVFGKHLAPFEDRVAMCERAVEVFGERASVCAVERELGGEQSRTYDTLVALRGRYPDRRFRLVIGSDILGETDRWHRWDEVERLGDPLVLERPGHPSERAISPALPDVSATAIRERLGEGGEPTGLVSRRVLAYIRERGLYA